MTPDCPICSHAALEALVEFTDMPVSGVFCADAGEQIPRRDLRFDYCAHCSFVSQRADASATIDYTSVARPTARQLPAYSVAMLERLSREGTEGLALEVGCNDGTFLNELRRAGFELLLGIEPSQDLARHVRNLGHTVVQQPLDQALAEDIVKRYGQARIVVCRHTLEHVPQPMVFLAALRRLLKPDGLACIEVPSLRPVIEYLHVHELWDEHVSYFLPETLALALGNAGFAIESLVVEPYREMENIVAWVRAGEPRENPPPASSPYAALCASFNARWLAARDMLLQALAACPAPIVALGASHPQSNFFNFSGLAARIDCVIDDDPHKIGRQLPLGRRTVPILPSGKLTEAVRGGTLVLSGFGYPHWMDKARKLAASHARAVIDVPDILFSAPASEEDAA